MDVHLVLKKHPDSGPSPLFQRPGDENKITFAKFQTQFDFKSISYNDDEKNDENIFNTVAKPLIENKFFNQEDSLLLTLGPTNSGKSHLLFQNENSIVNKSLEFIFNANNDIKFSNDFNGIKKFYPDIIDNTIIDNDFDSSISSYSHLSISMFELYNDNIIDLLNLNHNENDKLNLNIVTDPIDGKLTPKNISKYLINDHESAHNLIFNGLKNRKTFPTFTNNNSSRSHCFIFFNLHKLYGSTIQTTRFTIVDLAGLERSKISRTSGLSLKEASYTNGSLTELGRCLELISMKQFYKTSLRTNKLTRLVLNDFVKFNHPVNILVTLDPFGQEGLTLQTLRYIDPIKYQDLQRKSLLKLKLLKPNKVNLIEQKGLTEEIDRLRSKQQILKSKVSNLENSIVNNETKTRRELYEENEKNLANLIINHKEEINNITQRLLKQTDEKLQDQSNSYNKKIESLNEIIEIKTNELSESQKKLENWELEFNDLKADYLALTQQLDDLNSVGGAKILKLEQEIDESLTIINQLKAENEVLEMEIADLKSTHQASIGTLNEEKFLVIKNLEDKLCALESLNSTNISELENYQKLSNDNENKIIVLEQNKTELNNKISELGNELKISNDKISQLNTEIKSIHDKLAASSKLKDDEINKLNEELAKINSLNFKKIEILNSEINQLNSENLKLSTTNDDDIQKYKNIISKNEDEIKTVNLLLISVKEELKQANTNLQDELNKKNNELLSLQETAKAEIDNLKIDMDKKSHISKSLQNQVDTYNAKIESLNSELKSKNDKISLLQSKIEELKDDDSKVDGLHNEEILKLKSIVTKEIEQNKRLKQENDSLSSKYDNEVSNLTKQIVGLQKADDTLKRDLKSRSIELETELNNKKSSDEELAKLQMLCSDLKSELEDKQKYVDKYSSLKSKYSSYKEKVTKCESDIKQLTDDLQSKDKKYQDSLLTIKKLTARIESIEKHGNKPIKVSQNNEMDKALSLSFSGDQPINKTPRKSVNILDTDPFDDIGLPSLMSSPLRAPDFKIHNDSIAEKDNTINLASSSKKKSKSKKLNKKANHSQQGEEHEKKMMETYGSPKSTKKDFKALVNLKPSDLNKKNNNSSPTNSKSKLKRSRSSSPLKPGQKKVRKSLGIEDSLENLY